MKMMIAVKNHHKMKQLKNQNQFSRLWLSLHRVRDAPVEMIKEEDVAHQKILVMKVTVIIIPPSPVSVQTHSLAQRTISQGTLT